MAVRYFRPDAAGDFRWDAVEMLRYHAGWNFALNRLLGDEVFHPTRLVNFRQRLLPHEQMAVAFATILQALIEAGLVSRRNRRGWTRRRGLRGWRG